MVKVQLSERRVSVCLSNHRSEELKTSLVASVLSCILHSKLLAHRNASETKQMTAIHYVDTSLVSWRLNACCYA
jgi:hypothetical protein